MCCRVALMDDPTLADSFAKTVAAAPETGKRLEAGAEVDHRIPLHRVWYEMRGDEWSSLLGFWGLPNLQVINRDAHAAKCLSEAHARRGLVFSEL